MACCLTAPSHKMDQCWLNNAESLRYSFVDNFTGHAEDIYPWYEFKNDCFDITAASPSDVIMDAVASQITSLTIVYSAVYSGSDQRKHQSSTSLAFVRGIHQSSVNSTYKGPITRKMFPFDGVIMYAPKCEMTRKQHNHTHGDVKNWDISFPSLYKKIVNFKLFIIWHCLTGSINSSPPG